MNHASAICRNVIDEPALDEIDNVPVYTGPQYVSAHDQNASFGGRDLLCDGPQIGVHEIRGWILETKPVS